MKVFANLTSTLLCALHTHKRYALLPQNKFYFKFLKVLFREGFLSRVVIQTSGWMQVYPKYSGKGFCAFQHIKLLSKSGKGLHMSYAELTKLSLGAGLIILSTNKGLLSHHACLKLKIGGTALCYIS